MNRIEHLLIIASEETLETAHRISKALRFGLDEVQPGQGLTNAERIIEEYTQLVAVVKMLRREGALPRLSAAEFERAAASKEERVERYLQISAECGTLEP